MFRENRKNEFHLTNAVLGASEDDGSGLYSSSRSAARWGESRKNSNLINAREFNLTQNSNGAAAYDDGREDGARAQDWRAQGYKDVRAYR